MNREVFAYTKGLSQLLQGSSEDVVRAYEEVKTVKDALSGLRREAEPQYNRIFKTSNNMAEVAETTMTIPRRCGRQNKRNNMPGGTPEVYYRRVLFIPFLDDLLEQLESRFSAMSAKSLIGLKLLPEVRMWNRKWECAESRPVDLLDTLQQPPGLCTRTSTGSCTHW